MKLVCTVVLDDLDGVALSHASIDVRERPPTAWIAVPANCSPARVVTANGRELTLVETVPIYDCSNVAWLNYPHALLYPHGVVRVWRPAPSPHGGGFTTEPVTVRAGIPEVDGHLVRVWS